MFHGDRNQMRTFFCQVYAKMQQGPLVDPLEQQLGTIIDAHPEYHELLKQPEAVASQDFTPENGQVNPYLHMAMHLSIGEQTSTNRPPGIRLAFQQLSSKHGQHEAEHRMMECLGKALWEAQRSNSLPNELNYLECVKTLV
ncbi:MAG: DUF1841 family protein [bacterium]